MGTGGEPIGPATVRKVERPIRLADRAYEEIRSALIGIREEPLERLGEEELARELSMSRTPVREALHRLSIAGMVEPAPWGGYMRRRTSLRGVREHCELRLLLEPHAAALAAERAARGGAAELAERVRGLDPLSPDDRVSFHLAIAEAAESEALPELIGGLNDLAALDEAYLGELEPSRAISSAGQEKILAAVEAGDAPAARRAMTEHLELIRDSMVAAVERGDDRERR